MPELIFIIVEPAREENVGAAARAMKTMGISNLRLVNPQCNHLGSRSRATAHASAEILETAGLFNTFSEAVADIDLIIASTAKRRTIYEDHHPVEELPDIILAKGDTISKTAVVFGREESGLSNEELSACHLYSNIPMVSDYPSLNLGQAVMVYSTYLSKIVVRRHTQEAEKPPVPELRIVRGKAVQVLNDVGLESGNIIYSRIMEKLMLMNKDEINLFHSFCKRYLMKYHNRIK